MQTTLRIQDALYRAAKSEAAREGITLTRFLESALQMRLLKSQPTSTGKPHPFPIYESTSAIKYTNEEIKRFAQEDELEYDLRKLGIK